MPKPRTEQLVTVVHGGTRALRSNRHGYGGAARRELLCTYLGKLLVMPVLACAVLPSAPSASRRGALCRPGYGHGRGGPGQRTRNSTDDSGHRTIGACPFLTRPACGGGG